MKYVPPIGAADPNEGYVTENLAAGIEGSPVAAEAIEHPMREIMAAIVAAGLTPNEEDLTQLAQVIASMAPDDHVHLTEEIVDLLPDPHEWLRGQRYPVSTLVAVDAAVTWDMGANPVAVITLVDAVTTITLTNAQPGATYELTVRQDATGGRSIALPASVLWPGGTALEVTQDANAEDLVMFSVRGTVGSPVIRGFAALNMQVVA
ncbi:hypothetical protein [Desulfovibrio psychrotolerans]|uniref:Uncharacterized protein n=1 Tax=Desulfovibrio psychrotolerans TaxID=415242 RepID=A0A7J0BVH2_9BACT|nr:hypothetical protein [Desulfovibrio psychrotolerans]GFM37668.1 hypothetical protein DSM19430T_23520 [Desulfovibrio psychrotolerans]